MTEYIYLLKSLPRRGKLEGFPIVGEVVEPKSKDVLDLLDALARNLGHLDDEEVRLVDSAGHRTMPGRMIAAREITPSAIRGAFEETPKAKNAVSSLLDGFARQPDVLFERPRAKKEWDTFRELFALRTLILQARAGKNMAIAICHD